MSKSIPGDFRSPRPLLSSRETRAPVWQSRLLGAVVLLAALGAAAHPAAARMPGDLNLRDTLKKNALSAPKFNGHLRIDWCPICHQKKGPAASRIGDDFLSDDYPDNICYECHKGWVELHPTRVDPNKSRLKVSVPVNVLPLRFIHEGWYTVVCMTCHDIHFPHNKHKLLRGFSKDRLQPPQFLDRMAFCESCHGQQMEYLTPHQVRNLQTGCTLCHVRKPSARRNQPLRANVNVLCTYCHPDSPDHYFRSNPFPELEEDVIQNSGSFLRDGAYTCISCHKAHGTSAYPYYLQEEFVDLLRTAVRIDPHASGMLCQICHADTSLTSKSPNTARPKGLVSSDVSTLCSRCHGIGKIKSMKHYLGKPTDQVKVPKNLPLSAAGEITCITCHLPGCGPPSPDNPNFLRKYSASLRGFCTQCHNWTSLENRNAHAEFLEKRGCELCHERGVPAAGDAAGKPGKLKGDQNFVCFQCHEPDVHPVDRRHIGKPDEFMSARIVASGFPLDPYQRVTCNSCHWNCQQPPSKMLLRNSDAEESCSSCHLR